MQQLDPVQRLLIHVQYLKKQEQKAQINNNEQLILESDQKEVRKMMDLLSKILNTGIQNYKNYWQLFSNTLDNRNPLKFVNQLEFLKGEGEKAFLWLVIEFSTKQLFKLFQEIIQQLGGEYQDDSYINVCGDDILNTLQQLEQINYKVNSSLVNHYEQYMIQEQEKGNSIMNQSESYHHQSPSVSEKQSEKQSNYIEIEQDVVKKDYENYRESLYENQKNENDSDEEQQQQNQNQQNSQFNDKENQQNEKTKLLSQSFSQPQNLKQSSKIDLDKLLEFKEIRPSENKLFKRLYGSPDIKLDIAGGDYYLKQSENIKDNKFTQKLTNQYKKKRSQKLYEDEFEFNLEHLQFQYPSQEVEIKDIKQQNSECHLCKAKLSMGMYILCNNANYCHYYQAFVCDMCISNEKRILPWKILDHFDLKSYRVSKEAKKEIDILYDKAVIQFEYKSDFVMKNRKMYDFMIKKRSLYLLYDMICNPFLVEDLIQDKKNLLLKPNIFSLKNFYEINNKSLQIQVDRYLKLLGAHIEGCTKCCQSGFICRICNVQEKIFHFDILNTAVCDNCSHFYHKKCLEKNNCFNCLVNN